jgi:hypothetical protein
MNAPLVRPILRFRAGVGSVVGRNLRLVVSILGSLLVVVSAANEVKKVRVVELGLGLVIVGILDRLRLTVVVV